jgi:RNA polymerase sigma factor (sigma-70 family)
LWESSAPSICYDGGPEKIMSEATEADRYLLDQIAQGNSGAWSQLVARYHGRLLAFARSRLPTAADADDMVQETFLLFLQAFRTFRAEASLETFLFTILRRRMIDQFRGRRVASCNIADDSGDAQMLSPQHSPSWYVRRDEQTDLLEQAVAAGLNGMIRRLREQEKFDELRAVELLFYAQLRNKEVSKLTGMNEKEIGLLKFRTLEQVRKHVAANLTEEQREKLQTFSWDEADAGDSILTRVWEELRPTCPKRSTLGRMLLRTLDAPWRDYVEFHVNQLGCRFCQANLEDLRRESAATPSTMREKIFQSTVGFLKKG